MVPTGDIPLFKWRTIFIGFLAPTIYSAAICAAPLNPPQSQVPGYSAGQTPRPWQRVHLPSVLQREFAHSVVEVFEYGCPYCLHINTAVRSWGRTIPRQYTFSQMPALVAPQFLDMTLATFAVESYEPQDLGPFERGAFTLVQGYHEPINKPSVYVAAAIRAHIPAKAMVAQIESNRVQQLTQIDYRMLRATGIHQTPTLLICGRYAINPSMVHGNYSVFFELANGLLSRCIRHQSTDALTQPQTP